MKKVVLGTSLLLPLKTFAIPISYINHPAVFQNVPFFSETVVKDFLLYGVIIGAFYLVVKGIIKLS